MPPGFRKELSLASVSEVNLPYGYYIKFFATYLSQSEALSSVTRYILTQVTGTLLLPYKVARDSTISLEGLSPIR